MYDSTPRLPVATAAQRGKNVVCQRDSCFVIHDYIRAFQDKNVSLTFTCFIIPLSTVIFLLFFVIGEY